MPGIFTELSSDFFHHRSGCASYGFHCHRTEDKGEHDSKNIPTRTGGFMMLRLKNLEKSGIFASATRMISPLAKRASTFSLTVSLLFVFLNSSKLNSGGIFPFARVGGKMRNACLSGFFASSAATVFSAAALFPSAAGFVSLGLSPFLSSVFFIRNNVVDDKNLGREFVDLCFGKFF